MSKSARYRGESGQALVELAVSVVALMCVFLGVLFVSALGLENIQNALNARQSVDESLSSNPDAHAGTPIIRWDAGDDTMYLTKDDTPVGGLGGNPALHAAELTMDKQEVGDISNLSSFDLSALKGCSSVDSAVVDNIRNQLTSSNLFVYAAGLASATSNNDDPLASRSMGDITRAFGFLTNGGAMSLSDTAYMPYIESTTGQ